VQFDGSDFCSFAVLCASFAFFAVKQPNRKGRNAAAKIREGKLHQNSTILCFLCVGLREYPSVCLFKKFMALEPRLNYLNSQHAREDLLFEGALYEVNNDYSAVEFCIYCMPGNVCGDELYFGRARPL
jgi:hypothetical protein